MHREKSRQVLSNNIPHTKIVLYIGPYPPEAGTEYHLHLVNTLLKMRIPTIVLAGLTHMSFEEAIRNFALTEKYKNIILVYRAFWAPRIIDVGIRNLRIIIKYIIMSVLFLLNIIKVLRRFNLKVHILFHYGPTTFPGGILGEQFPIAILLARIMGADTIWVIHNFLTPIQILNEARERGLPFIVGLFVIAYYLIISKICGLFSRKIVVLVNSRNALITRLISQLGIASRGKILEDTHPVFNVNELKYTTKATKTNKSPYLSRYNTIVIGCIGYIRKGKGYDTLIRVLYRLRTENRDLFNRIKVKIIGAIACPNDIKNLVYVSSLVRKIRALGLKNIKFEYKKLSDDEFIENLMDIDAVWCAYEKEYGPSGIMAWAKALNKRIVAIANSLWTGSNIYEKNSFENHVKRLLDP